MLAGVGFMNGFMVSYMAEAKKYDLSNVQIHHPDFHLDHDVNFIIPDGAQKLDEIRAWPEVSAATSRVLVNAMISSAKKSSGVQIRGINVEEEDAVTDISSLIVDGAFFEGVSRNPVVIGSKLAEELQVKVRSKIVLTFTDKDGEMVAAAFRVAGIVKSSSLKINETYAYVRQGDILPLIGLENGVHEIAMVTPVTLEEEVVVKKYAQMFPEDLAQGWREIAPELAVLEEAYGQMLYVLMFIILTALVFGIINTMLMAVLERIREIGMLMAVGMAKMRVFMMIVIETVYLSLVAAPFGLAISYFNIEYYAERGVDLSAYSEGLEAFGYSQFLYPYLDPEVYIIVTVGIVITAILGAIYPALKAIKLKPVEALHKF
jgi:ABC-type lipoprotein release transport system permease subunit